MVIVTECCKISD